MCEPRIESPLAAEALRRIGELYEVERQARGMDAASRLRLRQTGARPKLDALRTWLMQTRISVADGGATAKALDYSIQALASADALCRQRCAAGR